MKRLAIGLLCAAVASVTAIAAVPNHTGQMWWKPRPQLRRHVARDQSFQRIATIGNYRNNGAAGLGEETVSEIIAATANGRTLVYTDSPMGAIGFIDITNPAHPVPTGKVAFGGGDDEPTSVDVLGNRYALVAVNSSASFTDTSGYVAVVDIQTRTIVRTIDLGGQPDSLKISKDRRYAAIAIENERDEDLCAGGGAGGLEIVDEDDYVAGSNTTEDLCESGGGVPGGLPQTPYGNPAGYLVVLELNGSNPFSWTRADVMLTNLGGYGQEDPEPEFVDINSRNQAVVTMQENNHIAIVDLRTRTIVNHFTAGQVDLSGIDTDDNDDISLTDSKAGVAREPDATAWVPGPFGRHYVATANEGDLFGGSRGFSIFKTDGGVVYDSGSEFEEIAVQHGHYPDARSDAKGAEPESIVYDSFGGRDYLFVGSERGSFVAVYELNRLGRPTFSQLLPAPLGPEGLLTIPGRGLLIASGEEDDPEFGVRSTVMIYQLQRGQADYPQILSDDSSGSPIPWSALSGLTSVPGQPDTLYGVWDGFYDESRIFRIDVSERPAVITDSMPITGGALNDFDPEGIAIAPDATIWVASEGNASDSKPNMLLHINPDGSLITTIGLPPEIIACRAASTNRGTLGSGFEGVAVINVGGGSYKLAVAQQRGWDYTTPGCEDLDDDEGGLNAAGQPNRTRIWVYDPDAATWDYIAWELAPKPENASWVGLSEITATPYGELILIERDNLTGDFAELKTLVKIRYNAADDRLVEASEKSVNDILPLMKSTRGWVTDKPEGVAVLRDGRTFLVTDNDGVDDWSGETSFFPMGRYWRLFR